VVVTPGVEARVRGVLVELVSMVTIQEVGAAIAGSAVGSSAVRQWGRRLSREWTVGGGGATSAADGRWAGLMWRRGDG
jgi:hypothetical protein